MSGLGASDAPPTKALVAVVQHGPLAGRRCPDRPGGLDHNRSVPTIVTSAGTSGARWRMRTDAVKRSRGGAPAVKRAPSTEKVLWATSSRRPMTTVFVAGWTSRT